MDHGATLVWSMNPQRAAEHEDSFPNGRQAKTGLTAAGFLLFRGEPSAVIGNGNREAVVGPLHLDLDGRGLGVLLDIGEKLLENAIKMDFGRGWQNFFNAIQIRQIVADPIKLPVIF